MNVYHELTGLQMSLDSPPKLGIHKNATTLLPHQPKWAELFADEAARIQNAIGPFTLDIQHIGSTSIPGISAKPIIDIGVAVADFDEAKCCVQPLIDLGYQYLGELGIPRRHYFVKGSDEARTHHLHINELQSADWRQHISFRDHLRQHPDVAQRYAELKVQLAAEYPNERRIYTEAKSGFITNVLSQVLPDLWPKEGETVTVRVFKGDRKPYRLWQCEVESVETDRIVTISPAGTLITDYVKGNWMTKGASRRYFWYDRPYNLLESYLENGNLLDLKIDIARPVLVKRQELVFFDYELDILKHASELPLIVDQDEFAKVASCYQYSTKFQAYCYQAANEAMALAQSWRAKGSPY